MPASPSLTMPASVTIDASEVQAVRLRLGALYRAAAELRAELKRHPGLMTFLTVTVGDDFESYADADIVLQEVYPDLMRALDRFERVKGAEARGGAAHP